MNNENKNSKDKYDLPPLPAEMGRLATVDSLLNEIQLDSREPAKPDQNKSANPLLSPPAMLSAEEFARQQDLQARLSDQNNPHFD